MITRYLKAALSITAKDLLAEWRSRETLSAMLVFALLVLFIFNFALELEAQRRADITAGVLWVTFVFAGTLSLNRLMAAEKDRGSLDGLLLAPVDRTAIYFGKALANLAFMLAAALVVLPVFTILFNTNLFLPELLLVILLGVTGYSAAGTLIASMAVQARTRDILLPVLLFPLIVPLLVAAVNASRGLLSGLPLSEVSHWVNLLLVYDAIFSAAGFMVFDYVVEE